MHRSGYVWLIIVTWIVLVATIFLATASQFAALGIFQGSVSDSTADDLDFNPARWVFFIIWPSIFIYQIICLTYATVNIFRRSADGTPLYACAPFIHWSTFVAYMIGLIGATAWLFVDDRQIIKAVGVIPIVISALGTIIATALSIYGIYRYYPLLAQNGFRKENRYVLGLMSNAFAMLGTWLTVATHLQLGAALSSDARFPQQVAATIILSILTVLILIWVLLDLAFLEKFTRFLYSPYVVLIFALSGFVAANYDGNDPNTIITLMLLIVAILMLCVKICLVVHRELKMPAFKKPVIPATTIIFT